MAMMTMMMMTVLTSRHLSHHEDYDDADHDHDHVSADDHEINKERIASPHYSHQSSVVFVLSFTTSQGLVCHDSRRHHHLSNCVSV